MAKLTREQYNKFNDGLDHGFRFDHQFYILWNEKRVVKYIDMENGNKLEVVIEYIDNNRSASFKPIDTYIRIGFQEYSRSDESDCWFSTGTAKEETIGSGYKRKMFDVIKGATRLYSDETLLKYFSGADDALLPTLICYN